MPNAPLNVLVMIGAALGMVIEEQFPEGDVNQPALFMDIPVCNNKSSVEFAKKLIIVIDDSHDSSLERILSEHTDIIFLSNLSGYAARPSVIQALYDCDVIHLAYFVDYINARYLLSDNKRQPWCGSHKATKEYLSHYATHTCRPISKHKVSKFCSSHHLAIRLPAELAGYTVKELQQSISPDRMKVIAVSAAREGQRRNLQQLSDSQQARQQGYDSQQARQQGYDRTKQGFDLNQQRYDSTKQEYDPNHQGFDSTKQGFDSNHQGYDNNSPGYGSYHEHQFLLRQDSGFSDIMELFNYLDVHIPHTLRTLYQQKSQQSVIKRK